MMIGRASLLEELKRCLLRRERSSVTTLQGLPGVGKTTLAITLTAHPEVRAFFTDGIFWAGLGLNPNILELLNHWGTLLNFDASTRSTPGDLPSWTEALHKATSYLTPSGVYASLILLPLSNALPLSHVASPGLYNQPLL